MSNKILVLGYFGYTTNQLDGQTVKTRNIYELIKKNKKEEDTLMFFDTEIFKTNKTSYLKMILLLFKCNKLIYLPAHNNLTYFFPLVYSLSLVKRFEIHYIVVGGWLAEYLKQRKTYQKLLSIIQGIYAESKYLSSKLREIYSFKNVVTLHNFRIQDFTPDFKERSDGKFKIIFMARINKLKGVEGILKLAEIMKQDERMNGEILIDFYGPLFSDYENEFITEVKSFSFVDYKGILQPGDIYKTLYQYDLMVLPTQYFTEGFPGSILDAYISSVSVVVSEWKHAREFVEDGKTGLIYKWGNEEAFFKAVMKLYFDRSLLGEMKKNALAESKKYAPDRVWKIINEHIFT